MEASIFRRASIGVLLVLTGCAPAVSLQAGWYFLGAERELHVAVYNWGSEVLKNTELVVNEGENGKAEGWKYPGAHDRPLNIPPGRVVVILLGAFKKGDVGFPTCYLPTSLKATVEEETGKRSKPLELEALPNMPSQLPKQFENCPDRATSK